VVRALTALLLAATLWPKEPGAKDRALPLGSEEGISREQAEDVYSAPASSQELTLPPAPAGGGWTTTPTSMLLYSASGKTLYEIGLGSWEEDKGSYVVRRVMRGRVSKDGRFAWHWEKVRAIRRQRADAVLASTHTFAFLATNGYMLWNDDDADAPPGQDPALMSDNGENILVRELRDKEWTVAAVNFTGNRMLELPAGSRIDKWDIVPSGRFAYFCWSGFEKPLVCTFLDLENRAHKDMPAADMLLEGLTLQDDGSVLAGSKVVLRLR